MHVLGKTLLQMLKTNDGLAGKCEGEWPGGPLLCCYPLSRGCCLCRDCRLQHPLGCRGGDGRLHRLPRPQPLPAEHVALPGAAGRDAGAERGADPGGGLRRCAHPRRDARPHRLRYVG